MSNIPFRDMRTALKLTQAQTQLLLGVPEIEWKQDEYALFFTLAEMSNKIENPTRPQLLMILATWLRFQKRLIESLPEDEPLRGMALTEFGKISEPYGALLEVKTHD